MSSLLASPRRRRRLAWASSLLIVAGVVTAVVTLFPGPEEAPAPAGRGWMPPKAEKEVKLSRETVASGLAVADRFVRTAVLRKNVGASWDLVAPDLRQGFTRAEWAQGEIPVVPFSFTSLRWRIAYTYANTMGLEVALFPKPGSKTKPAVFNVDLRAADGERTPHWLVENFTPTVLRSVPPVAASGGATGGSGLPNLSPAGGGPQRLGSVWLVVPFAVIGLAILFPVGLGLRNWRRGRRAERDWAEGRALSTD